MKISQESAHRGQTVAIVGRGLGRVPAPGLVIGGVVGLQSGAALTTTLYSAVGPAGVVTLRLCIAAVVLIAVWRPGRRWDRKTWAVVMAAGTLLMVHHLSYYEAVDRLPLGIATTVEFTGPFLIAAIGSRRVVDLLCSCLAAAGVLLLGVSGDRLSFAGLGFAALAGCCWGGYIIVGKRLAHRVPDGRGLALAVAWGALLSLPYGLAQGGARLLRPSTLALAAAVAILSSVLPYSFQFEALRRLSRRVFSVLTSVEPAVGALIGLLFLGQRLTLLQWLGIIAVSLASIGATRSEGMHEAEVGLPPERGEILLRERSSPVGESRRKFDQDFRDGAVRIVRETNKPIAQVARELGVNEGTLGNWVAVDRRRREAGDGALDADERAELTRLRREVAELQMERDVLKRSVALWVKEAMGR